MVEIEPERGNTIESLETLRQGSESREGGKLGLRLERAREVGVLGVARGRVRVRRKGQLQPRCWERGLLEEGRGSLLKVPEGVASKLNHLLVSLQLEIGRGPKGSKEENTKWESSRSLGCKRLLHLPTVDRRPVLEKAGCSR